MRVDIANIRSVVNDYSDGKLTLLQAMYFLHIYYYDAHDEARAILVGNWNSQYTPTKYYAVEMYLLLLNAISRNDLLAIENGYNGSVYNWLDAGHRPENLRKKVTEITNKEIV
jgi:hypothetical protein